MSTDYSRTTFAGGNMTIADCAALNLVGSHGAEQRLNAYWDAADAKSPFRTPDSEPTRLTESGRGWLAGMHTRSQSAEGESELIPLAREIIRTLGTLTVIRA